eukprot:15453208-Alexandrium_andersonii.AAC.1
MALIMVGAVVSASTAGGMQSSCLQALPSRPSALRRQWTIINEKVAISFPTCRTWSVSSHAISKTPSRCTAKAWRASAWHSTNFSATAARRSAT